MVQRALAGRVQRYERAVTTQSWADELSAEERDVLVQLVVATIEVTQPISAPSGPVLLLAVDMLAEMGKLSKESAERIRAAYATLEA
jgi:hypothetical protein